MQVHTILVLLILVIAAVYLIREQHRYVLFRKYLDMSVHLQFHDVRQSMDAYKRGSVVLELRDMHAKVKTVVITKLQFSTAIFQVTAFDQIYFKSKTDKAQVLSVSFKVRRSALSGNKSHNVQVSLQGYFTDQHGREQTFKARIPVSEVRGPEFDVAIS